MKARGLGVQGGAIGVGLISGGFSYSAPAAAPAPAQVQYTSFMSVGTGKKVDEQKAKEQQAFDVRIILHDDDEVLIE